MKPLLSVRKLSKHFGSLRAVDDVSFEIYPGETLGLVGESGCGKSTTGRCLLHLETPTAGEVLFEGEDVCRFNDAKLQAFRKKAQIIFQDPYASLNPRMTAEEIIAEPLQIHRNMKGQELSHAINDLLDLVGLSRSAKTRFPHEFSGGQRQRIGIARALAIRPRFLVCDEPISALDVSVQAQIINLLQQLQQDLNLSYLLIAHDLAMVKYISSRVAVMYLGHLVELGPAEELYRSPQHPYTQALLSAIPIPDPIIERKRQKTLLKEHTTTEHSKGCPFAPRCPLAQELCHHTRPELKEISAGHHAACHLIAPCDIGKKVPQVV